MRESIVDMSSSLEEEEEEDEEDDEDEDDDDEDEDEDDEDEEDDKEDIASDVIVVYVSFSVTSRGDFPPIVECVRFMVKDGGNSRKCK